MARNIKARYKRSVLGIVWTLLNPLLMMSILALVFSQLFQLAAADYAIYVLSGLTLWAFFSQATLAMSNEIVHGSYLMKQLFMPRTSFAVAAMGSGLINLALALIPLALLMVVLRVPLSFALLSLPLAILLVAMFTLGVGLIVSCLAVFFADVLEIYRVALTAWLYLTPIIYPISIIPDRFLWLLKLNPMYHLVELFRAPIYQGACPALHEYGIAAGMAIAVLLLGWWSFTRSSDAIAYLT